MSTEYNRADVECLILIKGIDQLAKMKLSPNSAAYEFQQALMFAAEIFKRDFERENVICEFIPKKKRGM